MVSPRYGSSCELKNLASLCDHHYEGFGHMFADLLQPAEWYQIRGISWREVAGSMRDQYAEQKADSFVETLDELLDRGQPENPYPYIEAWHCPACTKASVRTFYSERTVSAFENFINGWNRFRSIASTLKELLNVLNHLFSLWGIRQE